MHRRVRRTEEIPQEERAQLDRQHTLMNGTSALDGKRLSGVDHLRQSIRDILTTPIGSRVMRRDYGSRLFALVDAPLNRSTVLEIIAAAAEAIVRWEKRIQLQRVRVLSADADAIELTITGTYLPDGRPITLDGIRVQ